MCWDRVIACESADFEEPRLLAVASSTPLAVPLPSAASEASAQNEISALELVS